MAARIARFDLLDSTNDKARSTEFGHGEIIIAEAQSAGRGQRGNSWDSRCGENLTFSLVLEPDFLPAEDQFLLLQCVALGIADLLCEYGIDPQIKWPNDIYVAGNKVAGVLIENDICGTNLSRSIVGIGLNVNQTEFAEWVPNPTSMTIETGTIHDRNEVLLRLHRAIMNRYSLLESGNTELIQSDYHRTLYLLNIPHLYTLPSEEQFYGVVRAVETNGELQVEHPDGTIKGYLFKEIQFGTTKESL